MSVWSVFPRLAALALLLCAAEAVAAQSAREKLDLDVPPGLFTAEEAADARREGGGESATDEATPPTPGAVTSGLKLDAVDQPNGTRWGGGAPEDPIGLRLGVEVPLDDVHVKRER